MGTDQSEEQTAALLAEWYEPYGALLTPDEEAALRYYQASDDAYELVNGVLRGTIDTSDLDEDEIDLVSYLIAGLTTALARSPLADNLIVWRGVRDVEGMLGGKAGDCSSLIGAERRMAGFSSCSVFRQIAEEWFTDPDRGALLRISVTAGISAAYLPFLEDPDFEDEGELLLEEDLVCTVTGCEEVDGILILECEVKR